MTTVVHVPRRLTPRAWGGTERVLAETLPRLAWSGLRQRVFTTRALDEDSIAQLGNIPITRYRYHYAEWPLSAFRRQSYDQRGGNVVSFPLARALAGMRDLSLVHCHTANRLGAQCLEVARRRGVPCVVTLHGGHFAVPRVEKRRWSEPADGLEGFELPRLPWGKVLSWWWRTRAFLERVDAVVCVGIEEFELAKKHLPRVRVELLPGGVDVQAFARGDRAQGRQLIGVAPSTPLIVCIARLDPQKDQATILRALPLLRDREAHVALIGAETEPGYANHLRALAGDLHERVHVIEGLPTEAVPDLLAAADVAVLASRHEPFGLSCIEAWAAHRPLVAADVGGPKWLLEGRREGILFPVGDAPRLAAALEQVLGDESLRRSLAEAGAHRARLEFTWDRRAAGLLELYESLGVCGNRMSNFGFHAGSEEGVA